MVLEIGSYDSSNLPKVHDRDFQLNHPTLSAPVCLPHAHDRQQMPARFFHDLIRTVNLRAVRSSIFRINRGRDQSEAAR